MKDLYQKPLRVYLLLGALALWGILSAFQLPVSLFPASSQVTISVSMGYGSLTSEQFFDSLGKDLEGKLQSTKANQIGVLDVTAQYSARSVRYIVKFDWGADSDLATRNIENQTLSLVSNYDEDIRRSMRVNSWRQNSGFLAISFYSPLRSLDDLFKTLDPILSPIYSRVPDASGLGLYNPNRKEISIRLNAEKMALYSLKTSEIERSLREGLVALNGGNLKIGEQTLQVSLPKKAYSKESLETLRVSPLGRQPILLRDVAQVDINPTEESRQKFKTSGIESLILFADPKEGGNIKKMADDIMRELNLAKSQFPADVQYQILVNPADFIDQSVRSVLKEVGLAAFLAVVVLFLFIGSFKNVATAAIEIPLSLLMAFILMKMTGMNLNLISLGGLALSAGMNVDASVVVLENIFRHFEGKSDRLTYQERLKIIVQAVREVWAPILASTLASLVVFLPLIFTDGLTNSLLGDLAKAVIFSHGLSAFVALILVPTIRLQLMAKGAIDHGQSPIEKQLRGLEKFYRSSLGTFLNSWRIQAGVFVAILALLPLLIFTVTPKLKKEVIGKPETDWLIVGINSPLITNMMQMESELGRLEADLMKNFGDQILYTFTQFQGADWGNIMVRLKSRHIVEKVNTQAEEIFKSTPTLFYWMEQWNPSELEIPDPPAYRLEIIGGTHNRRLQFAEDIQNRFNQETVYDKVRVQPAAVRQNELIVRPHLNLTNEVEVLSRYDLSHYLRVATGGVWVDRFYEGSADLPIYLRLSSGNAGDIENLEALPVGFEGKLIPLSAVANFSLEQKGPDIYRQNQRTMMILSGRPNKSNTEPAQKSLARANKVVEEYRAQNLNPVVGEELPTLVVATPDQELQDAFTQVKWAVLISIALIFLVMVLQLGDIFQAGLVLVSIPLGLIGVLVALFVFRSSLSLNSGLGIILLNGLAVANSIILVDFIRRLFDRGQDALSATIDASAKRLRPILMTSLTTILGMLPIALGLGEGGKILQPLGIAVSGGLWVSTLLTLYIVPALQYWYLKTKDAQRKLIFAPALPNHSLIESPIPSQSERIELQ